MEDCTKTDPGAVAALPDDLLLEIFSRAPAKSLCRFKCVSKAWRDLIAHPDHSTKLRKKLRQAMQGLFIWMGDGYSFSLVDLTAAGSSVPLDVDPGFSFLTPGKMRNLVLSDSCGGLIYFGHHELTYYDGLSDVVCNPTTKQWACVPTCPCPDDDDDRSCDTYLAFDPLVSSHFHLLQFQFSFSEEAGTKLEALHAYSSEHGTWSRNQIDESQEEEQVLAAGWHRHVGLAYDCYEDRCHAFVNGFLYLLVQELGQRRIIVVDVQGKARRMIALPCVPDDGRRLTCYLEQSQGCLHCITQEILCAPEDKYKLSIWVLQGYDAQEWVLKNTASSRDLFGELTRPIFDLRVVHIHQDRNLVFLFQGQSGELIACDIDHKEVSVIATVKEWRSPIRFARYVPCFSESPALTSQHKE